MHPTELNAALAALTNHLYCTLSNREFLNLAILLSLLSKDMLSMEGIRDLCRWEEQHPPPKP